MNQGYPGRIQVNRAFPGRGGGYRPQHRRPPIRGPFGPGGLPLLPPRVLIPGRLGLNPVAPQGIELVGPFAWVGDIEGEGSSPDRAAYGNIEVLPFEERSIAISTICPEGC